MRVFSVVGARPQFVKLAPVSLALKRAGIIHESVHTGQHYDYGMSEVFFQELRIDQPRWNLGVGSGSHGVQTGAMLAALDELFNVERPDWVLTYGDTNSTVAAALAAVKLHIPVAHLEAGLRSFNRLMPEEHNRVLTDHASDLLLAPTVISARNLASEGLADRTTIVGDVMVDILLNTVADIQSGRVVGLGERRPQGEYVVATIHRAENTEDPARLRSIINALREIPIPVLIPVHPRLHVKASQHGIELAGGSLQPVQPLSYIELVDAVLGAVAVATDSGGLQKEAYVLGKPTTTIRTETEWVETLVDGWNVLAPDVRNLAATVLRTTPVNPVGSPYGDGAASEAVAFALSPT
jgi:UDP-N-acetylglucosamine 2-epimerase (non-hydrolysing)